MAASTCIVRNDPYRVPNILVPLRYGYTLKIVGVGVALCAWRARCFLNDQSVFREWTSVRSLA